MTWKNNQHNHTYLHLFLLDISLQETSPVTDTNPSNDSWRYTASEHCIVAPICCHNTSLPCL